MSLPVAVCVMLAAAAAACGQSNTVFRKVFTAITAPATSSPLPNAGQMTHLLTVIFPTASADVTTGLQIRIEASFDGTLYFPISRDITTAAYTAANAAAMAVERANAAYPFLRLRALAVPAATPMTAHYTGSSAPLGNIILQNGRLITSAPGGAGGDRVTWGVCPAADCVVANNLTVPFIVTAARTIGTCYVAAKTAPTGASIILDINANGASIFGAGTKLVLAAGQTYATQATIANSTLEEGDLLSIDIEQIGSTAAGRDLGVTCTLQ